jgi:ADP-heptose:LPS heptosyltransferase
MAQTLVVFHKQLGDTLLLQPALSKLATADGEAVDLLAFPRHAPLVALMPDARLVPRPLGRYRRLWCYDPGSRSCWGAFRARSVLKTLLVPVARKVRFFHRWTFDDIRCRPWLQGYRALHYWAETPGHEGAQFAPPVLTPPPPDWMPVDRWAIEGAVVLNPVSAWPEKSGTPKFWAELLDALADAGVGPLLLVSGPEAWQSSFCAAILADCRAPVTDAVGKTRLTTLIALLDAARLVVSVDGAVFHLAQALGTPSLGLFGYTKPLHWHYPTASSRALWAGDHQEGRENRRPALDIMPRHAVVEAALSLLEATR